MQILALDAPRPEQHFCVEEHFTQLRCYIRALAAIGCNPVRFTDVENADDAMVLSAHALEHLDRIEGSLNPTESTV